MHFLKKLYVRFISYFAGWSERPFKTVKVNDNLPTRMESNVLYIVVEDDYEEQAVMVCPCGCGNILQMNLLPDERPCWYVTIHEDKTASLHPSVWRKKGCCSHFWFKHGKVNWC